MTTTDRPRGAGAGRGGRRHVALGSRIAAAGAATGVTMVLMGSMASPVTVADAQVTAPPLVVVIRSGVAAAPAPTPSAAPPVTSSHGR
jgi:hypothetical protein